MRLTAPRVIALIVLYVILFVAVSGAVLFRHPEGSAGGPGSSIKVFSIPGWWWPLLVGPPLVLLIAWVARRGR